MKVRGKAGVEEIKGGKEQIVITQIPYNVNRATLVERIAAAGERESSRRHHCNSR